jgi:hypothetical protein
MERSSEKNKNGGGSGASSLNVACSAAIVLYMHALFADLPEAPRQGEKFIQSPFDSGS